ncbi:DUF1206 domain-containing protein [Paenisporosarcina cavernae]|nr:DUF1206 domain-containing protein [Paenisporosarcina cavernae]
MKEEVKPWIRRFGRFGYMAKGVVYAMIGILAGLAAIGPGGELTGTSTVLQEIAKMPFGEIVLWIIGIGLIGYIVWDLIKAFKDPENHGTSFKGIIHRIGYFVSGVIYANIAWGAVKLASHTGTTSRGSEKTISAKVMDYPFGVWLIGLVGVIIFLYGAYEFWSGYKMKFLRKIKSHEMSSEEMKVTRHLGRVGMMARGLVLAIIGFFFISTAYTHDPDKSKGLEGALTEVATKPFGMVLLGIVAIGLILYGIFQIIRGRYEIMNFGKHS